MNFTSFLGVKNPKFTFFISLFNIDFLQNSFGFHQTKSTKKYMTPPLRRLISLQIQSELALAMGLVRTMPHKSINGNLNCTVMFSVLKFQTIGENCSYVSISGCMISVVDGLCVFNH